MKFGYGFLPVVWSLYTFLVFLLCYLLAVHFHHVYPFLPAISDTGIYPPEGNIFSLLFTLSAFFGVINISVRYLQLRLVIEEDLLLSRLNKIALFFGLLSSFGATIIATFQSELVGKLRYLQVTHDVGAVLLFASGALYFSFQTILTYELIATGKNSKTMFVIRLILSFLITVCGVIFLIGSVFAYDLFCENQDDCRKVAALWRPGEPGYALHLLSNICEWLAALFFGFYSMTFFGELQKITVNVSCSEASNGKKVSLASYALFGHVIGDSDSDG